MKLDKFPKSVWSVVSRNQVVHFTTRDEARDERVRLSNIGETKVSILRNRVTYEDAEFSS